MQLGRLILFLYLLAGVLPVGAVAGPFSMFPKVGRLVSPDGRFEVSDMDERGGVGEFAGVFHSLWLTENATGRTRKLCDYVGIAAVAWSEKDFLLVTQYLSKKTSRALVFAASSPDNLVVLDGPALLRLVPAEMRPTLRENDHLFVEASRLEGDMFYFQVWGYGPRPGSGFHWNCEYGMNEGKASCATSSKTTFGK